MRHVELLAPAGNREALRAAVCAGANAVYLGYSAFGARASATFDADALAEAVAYAHLYHVRVHVTVNTLVKQSEVQAVYDALETIARCKADAIIVQDLGVARMARECFPSLELHASTQMAIHSAAGARFARAHGFERVVLARECSLQTIADVARTGVDTEVFAHGALCAAVSGECLMSSMAGGRSGNRGRCAQPCRQRVTLNGQIAALLSMRDLCLRDHLPELANAGVCSLKIEGRLKNPEYVATVTSSYRKALDALEEGRFAPMDADERRSLMQVFHRGGFTEGHAMGAQDAALCSIKRVNHGGVPVGRVQTVRGGLATVSLSLPIHDGDSLRIGSVKDVELRYSGKDAANEAIVRIREGERVSVGDNVDRLTDAAQLEAARALSEPKLPITMRAWLMAEQPMRLTISDGTSQVVVEGDKAQTPLKRSLTEADIAKQLEKLGDSPFVLKNAPVIETNGVFAPVSTLNALRRAALADLAEKRRECFFGKQVTSKPLCEVALPEKSKSLVDTLAVCFSDAKNACALQRAGAGLLLFEPNDLTRLRESLDELPDGAWLVMPPQLKDAQFAAVRPLLTNRLAGVVLGSVGQLGFDWPLPIALGDGVPVTNLQSASELLTDEVAFFTLWPELTADELKPFADLPKLLTVYGRERVMLLNHCPERVRRGLQKGRAQCALCGADDRACAAADASFTDVRGYRFPLTRTRYDDGCVVNVLNALPTELSRHDARRRQLGAGALLHFTIETNERQTAITERFAALLRGESVEPSEEQTTSGHFLRGVE